MKKILYSIMAMALLAGCSNAEDKLRSAEKAQPVDITACKIVSVAPTRVAYSESGNHISASWEETDAISLFSLEGTRVNRGTLKFVNFPNAGDKTQANFTGRLDRDVTGATQIYAYAQYPNVYTTSSGITNDFHFQTGKLTGEGSATTHDVLYATGAYDPSSTQAVKMTFSRRMAILKFVLNLPSDMTHAAVTACKIVGANLYNKVSLNIRDAALREGVQGSISIDAPGISVSGGTASFYAAVYPGELAAVCIPITIGGTKYSVAAGDITVGAGESKTIEVASDKFTQALYDVEGTLTDDEGHPMQGVVVSDSYTCVQTDVHGHYAFNRNAKARFVYYTVPADCAIPTHSETDRTACAYLPLEDGVSRYDFKLKKLAGGKENSYKMIVLGDPQVTNAYNPYYTSADDNQVNVSDVYRFTHETMADIKKTIATLPAGTPVYGLSMGDDVQYYGGYNATLESQIRAALGSSSMILFSVIGNHDQDGNAIYKSKWEENFGPTDYSFDRGDVHYVCFNNCWFYKGASYYQPGELTDEQMAWLEQDLNFVDKLKKVVLNYHIPLTFGTRPKAEATDLGIATEVGHYASSRLAKFMSLLNQFSGGYELFCGHTHFAINHEIEFGGQQILEHCHAAACGDIWQSNINICGTPNGYYVYTFDGTATQNCYYKGTFWDSSRQMTLFRADTDFNAETYAADWSIASGKGAVVANVFNADSKWRVYTIENGQKKEMTRCNSRGQDAFAVGYHHKYAKSNGYSFFSKQNKYLIMNHLYYYVPTDPNAEITVEATDGYGNTYQETTANVVTEPFYNYAHYYSR